MQLCNYFVKTLIADTIYLELNGLSSTPNHILTPTYTECLQVVFHLAKAVKSGTEFVHMYH